MGHRGRAPRIDDEGKALIRAIHREYLAVRTEEFEVRRKLGELMDRLDDLREVALSKNIKALAEQFHCSQGTIHNILQPRRDICL